ncbi:hypothetical protein AMJ49_05855 [Parcubacteria bacterium DG_74_2]|nr:MAG: hypothetical protein AMJ49_05855 [Parcubacteria bacterium DG_74_2]
MEVSQKQFVKDISEQYPSLEEILEEYSKEMDKKVSNNNSDTVFGFWMQTLADLQLLDLELSGLTTSYKIDSVNRVVKFNNDEKRIRNRIAHLDLVRGKPTLYSSLIDLFGDTNAYAFHNLYPYKGKFYPRVVRTLINTFNLSQGDIILDPYNGCGTTTHETSLMGIDSIGLDINPIGNIIAELKNELPFVPEKELNKLSLKDLQEIHKLLENRERTHKNLTMYKLMLMIYFDTLDAFTRTSRYNRKGEIGLFIEKFNYVKDCYYKTKEILNKFNINLKKAKIQRGNVLNLQKAGVKKNSIDAIITSPPYYFSLDYVGKDEIAYRYLNEIGFLKETMPEIKNLYLGMRTRNNLKNKKILENKVITYFDDLKKSVFEMANVLKKGGKIAIVIGDSTIYSKKLPTTKKTHSYAIEAGLNHIRTVFNPLLGARNRAIRGESILIYEK